MAEARSPGSGESLGFDEQTLAILWAVSLHLDEATQVGLVIRMAELTVKDPLVQHLLSRIDLVAVEVPTGTSAERDVRPSPRRSTRRG